MEMKSGSDCLNFTDSMIICTIEKQVGVGILEKVREYMIKMHNGKSIEEMVAMSAKLS